MSSAAHRPWKPNVTVATVIEREGRFLLIEERTSAGPRFNQPAGHLEPGESLIEAAARETLEETGYRFTPAALTGIYHHRHTGVSYIRFTFTGTAAGPEAGRDLDEGILRADWFTLEEIRNLRDRHRTPLVMRCIEDYLAGCRYPLAVLSHFPG